MDTLSLRYIKSLFTVVFFGLYACTTSSSDEVPSSVNEPVAAVAAPENVATESEINTAIASVDDRLESEGGGGSVGDEISQATHAAIPIEINDDVQKWITYFTTKDQERFQRFLDRGEQYRPHITAVLRDQGVPTEIYYQAMIESGFATAAKSSASAVGIWQFMRGTGIRYGLRVDNYVDERRDPMRSTIAAALYMKDLYTVFQSWYLAMASYNAGEGRILGAIMRAKTRDFWELVQRRQLPSETMNYIPKFLAATIIGHNPEKYGFRKPDPVTSAALQSIAVPSPVALTDIAKVAGISVAELKSYNPQILRGMTPPGVASYRIWVPKEEAALLEDQRETLAALRVKVSGRAAQVYADASTHTVKKGETLAKVAAQYGLSVKKLKKINNLASSQVSAGTVLKLVGAPSADRTAVTRYRVKKGDTLNTIARQFGTSVQDLREANRLRRTSVYVGQVLKIQSNRG